VTADDVATWMMGEVERDGVLYQESAAGDIEQRFGAEFAPANESGNSAIRRDVLAAFRALSGATVVWERGERLWRKRASFDEPGRRQD
jgi:hypothetical protein